MSEWQPIETAPKEKNKKLILFFPIYNGEVCVGYWDSDEYSSKPKPIWRSDNMRGWGVRAMRDHQPTHWQPIPEPPK